MSAKHTKKIPTHIEIVLGGRSWSPVMDKSDHEFTCEQIKRHVDFIESAIIVYETECVFCTYDPEPEDGVPQCCTKAQEAWAAHKEEEG